MKHFMLDTNICIACLRPGNPPFAEFVKDMAEDCCISAITLAELQYGVQHSDNPDADQRIVDQFTSIIPPASFDKDAAVYYGLITEQMRSSGHVIGTMDALIGAHALSLDMTVVTHNIRDFKQIPGLRIEDWTEHF